MTLIELLNGYDGEGLTATEQAVYFNLCLIWNKLRRPNWFAVSRAELMRKAGIKDHKTIDKARQSLESKRYISTQNTGARKPRQYHIEPPPAKGINPLVTKGNNPLAKGINPLANEPLGEIIPQNKGDESPRLGELFPPSQSTEYLQSDNTCLKDNLSPKKIDSSRAVKIQSSNLNSIEVQATENCPTTIPSGIPQKVLDFYQQEIRPICSPFELEKLTDDVEHYGGDAVVKAIERAVIRNKRNLGYVESILKHWESDGYDNGKGDRYKHDNMAGHSNQGESADEWADRLAREYNFDG